MSDNIATCFVCKKAHSKEQPLMKCSLCLAVSYCSKQCQKTDWKAGHKHICGKLNVGSEEQLTHPDHLSEKSVVPLPPHIEPKVQRLSKLFSDAPADDGTYAEARRIILRLPKHEKNIVMFWSLDFLINQPTDMLKKRTSPLLLCLSLGVDPSVWWSSLPQHSKDGFTALHRIAELTDPNDPATHENQLVLAKQLIRAGANVNARSGVEHDKVTPLHAACHSGRCTNPNLIQLLLDSGANPNSQDLKGHTPLTISLPHAVAAAKLLLQHPSIDVNIVPSNGLTALDVVRQKIGECEMAKIVSPDAEGLIFSLKQLQELEELMVAKGAVAAGECDH